ncbi:MAG: tetratricopeptide repeat protein [Gammaproteobacteria bacterium]|nr:tetratricopeptide repeat protein [Gammaproteobacteria bacterium]
MKTLRSLLLLLLALFFSSLLFAQETEQQGQMDARSAEKIEGLEEPLYNPFVERYVLDELKNLRQELADQRATMIKTVTDRELSVADRSMTYAVDTITYFFYVIAAVSALLVILGWNSMREVKDKVEQLARQEVARISETFEERLRHIEDELHQKSENIRATQHQLSITNEIHSLWLKATQETQPENKIAIYDQILAIKPDDTEALTYKADEALVLGETSWARSLCNRALAIDPENGHAYYQRACAYAEVGALDEALGDLNRAIEISPAFRDNAADDSSFEKLRSNPKFIKLISEAG